jgi:hypothetical protein
MSGSPSKIKLPGGQHFPAALFAIPSLYGDGHKRGVSRGKRLGSDCSAERGESAVRRHTSSGDAQFFQELVQFMD